MNLQEFFDYKNQLMKDVLTHPNIYTLLGDNITKDNVMKLAYTQVFPYEYVNDTIEEGMTFICFDVDVQESLNKTYLEPIIYVWVFTHKSQLRLPDGGVRTDKLCNEICKVINGSRYYGLGELNLYSVRRFAPMIDYQGKAMTFHAKDFNHLYDPKKPTPANRREG